MIQREFGETQARRGTTSPRGVSSISFLFSAFSRSPTLPSYSRRGRRIAPTSLRQTRHISSHPSYKRSTPVLPRRHASPLRGFARPGARLDLEQNRLIRSQKRCWPAIHQRIPTPVSSPWNSLFHLRDDDLFDLDGYVYAHKCPFGGHFCYSYLNT